MATKSITMDITISDRKAINKIVDALLSETSIEERRKNKVFCEFEEVKSNDLDKYY